MSERPGSPEAIRAAEASYRAELVEQWHQAEVRTARLAELYDRPALGWHRQRGDPRPVPDVPPPPAHDAASLVAFAVVLAEREYVPAEARFALAVAAARSGLSAPDLAAALAAYERGQP